MLQNTCKRCGVQCKELKDGAPQKVEYFDEPQLEIADKGNEKMIGFKEVQETGGCKEMPKSVENPK